MRLDSLDGRSVSLNVTGYQFPGGRSPAGHRDWDANWLVVHGEVRDADDAWSFEDPCLTTWEALELASWLRSAQSPTGPDRLDFTEPNLEFTRNRVDAEVVVIDVRFDAESRAPFFAAGDGPARPCPVRLVLPLAALENAIGEWEHNITRFPAR